MSICSSLWPVYEIGPLQMIRRSGLTADEYFLKYSV